MKFTVLSVVVLALLGANVQAKVLNFAASDAAAASGQNFGSALEMFVLAFQRAMPCGSAKLHIPKLAPFTLPYFSYQHQTEYLKINANFSNIVVTGLNSLAILGGSYNTISNHMTYDFIYPEVHLLTENALSVWAFLAGYPMQIDAQGLNNVRITDFRFVGSFDVMQNPSNPNGLRITNFNLNFYIGDILFNNWNNLWNIAANNFVNKWARDAVLTWAEQIQGQVDAIYDQLVLPLVNNALADVDMAQVINFFEQEAQLFNSISCNQNGNSE